MAAWNPWVLLAIAGGLEIVWALGLKLTDGFSRLGPSLITGAAMILSYVFLSFAVRTLPIGTAYAIWTGIGVAGAAIGGVFLFNEPVDALRIGSILLILCGLCGLKLAT